MNENEYVTTDIDFLSPILQNSEDSFNHKKSIGLQHLRDYTSILLPKADLTYLADQTYTMDLFLLKMVVTFMISLCLVIQNMLLIKNIIISKSL